MYLFILFSWEHGIAPEYVFHARGRLFIMLKRRYVKERIQVIAVRLKYFEGLLLILERLKLLEWTFSRKFLIKSEQSDRCPPVKQHINIE